MKTINQFKILFVLTIVFASCQKDTLDPINNTVTNSLYEKGYFVINEGNMGDGDGSISYINENGLVQNNVFSAQNDADALGDVVQSMSIIGDYAYIAVNKSGTVQVVSADSMKYISTIEVGSPRYIKAVSENKAYVTDWSTNSVQVIDLTTNLLTSSISCGSGPEALVTSGNFAYICNSGGLNLDNTVSVINISTDIVENTLTVGDKPNSAVVDVNGAVWILSGGYTVYDPIDWSIISQSQGSLVKIVNNSIDLRIDFPIGNNPKNLIINDAGTELYFSNNGIFNMDISDSQLPSNPIINRSFYGLGYNNGYIHATDAVDYVQNGWTFRYTDCCENNLVDSVEVGRIPGGYCFN